MKVMIIKDSRYKRGKSRKNEILEQTALQTRVEVVTIDIAEQAEPEIQGLTFNRVYIEETHYGN